MYAQSDLCLHCVAKMLLKHFSRGSVRGSRKFCQRGSNFDNVFFFLFFFFEGRKDQNTTISGPSSARQRNAGSVDL